MDNKTLYISLNHMPSYRVTLKYNKTVLVYHHNNSHLVFLSYCLTSH
jgi:hypothetical protein